MLAAHAVAHAKPTHRARRVKNSVKNSSRMEARSDDHDQRHPKRKGALVVGLVEAPTATAAGLRVGDLIVSVNHYPVSTSKECIKHIDQNADVLPRCRCSHRARVRRLTARDTRVRVRHFKQVLDDRFPIFKGSTQHGAHEFLCAAFDVARGGGQGVPTSVTNGNETRL
jgi:hypothetical protein